MQRIVSCGAVRARPNMDGDAWCHKVGVGPPPNVMPYRVMMAGI